MDSEDTNKLLRLQQTEMNQMIYTCKRLCEPVETKTENLNFLFGSPASLGKCQLNGYRFFQIKLT